MPDLSWTTVLCCVLFLCVAIQWRILGGAWTRWKNQGERAANPEQWHWVWNHYVRHTMRRGAESLSTTPIILITKQGQLCSSWETIISSMFQTLAIILPEQKRSMLSLPARLHVFYFSKSHKGIILLSGIYTIQTNVTKSLQTFL